MTKLAELMSAKGLTDKMLAEMVRAPEPEIWRLRRSQLNRGQKMTHAWAHRLAPVLDVDWSELLDHDPNSKHEDPAAPDDAVEPRAGPPAPKGKSHPATRHGMKSETMRAIEQEALNRDDLRI